MYYSTEEVTNNIRNFNQDISIVSVEYNSYFHLFVVLTMLFFIIKDLILESMKLSQEN